MRVVSLHPGVALDDVVARTGFPLVIPADVPTTRTPDANERAIMRALDPNGRAQRELGT